MTNIWIGMVAGFIATAALSALMAAKQAIRLMPELDLIGMIADMTGMSRPAGWFIHFLVGTVLYGIAFAVFLAPALGAGVAYWLKGAILGAAGWLLAMVALMPMAGKGLFGMAIGAMAPVMSLVMHLIFGGILGWAYGALIA